MKKLRILITPKEGLLDPQGRAVEEMLKDNGFKVQNVRVGKLVELELEDDQDVTALVEKYIINPLIEDYEIEELEDK